MEAVLGTLASEEMGASAALLVRTATSFITLLHRVLLSVLLRDHGIAVGMRDASGRCDFDPNANISMLFGGAASVVASRRFILLAIREAVRLPFTAEACLFRVIWHTCCLWA